MTEQHQHDEPVVLKFTGTVHPLPVVPEDQSSTDGRSDEPAVLPFLSAEQLALREEEKRQRALLEERLQVYKKLMPLIEAIAANPERYPEVATPSFYLRDALREALSPNAEARRAFESPLHAS